MRQTNSLQRHPANMLPATAIPATPVSQSKFDAQMSTRSPKTQRISALDFTKGTLVLIMVLYHWINYFIGPQWEFYRYLRFLTPSFIFITGFMISNIYLVKYDASNSRLPKRLVTRGLKLLGLFILLNVARTFIIPVLSTGVLASSPLSLGNLFTIFVSGNLPVVAAKLVSFSILVPISYVLMFCGVLVFPYRRYKYAFHVACAALLLSVLILGIIGAQCSHLELVTIGMLGVLAGFEPIAVINEFVRHPYALALAYLFYTIAITIWNVPFVLQLIGVPLSVIVIYLLGLSFSDAGRLGSEIVLLGKYSLFGYISQMAIIQLLNAGFRHLDLGIAALCVSFAAAFALTIVTVEALDRTRTKVPSIDSLYKAVFA
jgi:peptidoglycan/LPS O-acetylase OafA/YrhL